MADFMIRFLLCNIILCIPTGIFLSAGRLFRNSLTPRMRYNIWFLLLGLLAVPFIPVQLRFFPPFQPFQNTVLSHSQRLLQETSPFYLSDTPDLLYGVSIAAGGNVLFILGRLLFVVWISGILLLAYLLSKSIFRFQALKKSSQPLQNPAVNRLYRRCLEELNIKKPIPVYSTAFLKSPVMAGLFKPRIYLPTRLLTDFPEKELRFMLLHELLHYRYRDALVNCLLTLAGILYWFNPFVWIALREMKNDREIACDTSVLDRLDKDAYTDYGKTLINFSEAISVFPFASGMSGSMKQMKKRITNIAAYRTAYRKKWRGFSACALITAAAVCFVPLLSTQAADYGSYDFSKRDRQITYLNLQNLFDQNDGSFVLYDAAEDSWQIYNMQRAVTRISPISTFKIYSALFALESGIISPEQSFLSWNGQHYTYDLWNTDQTLESAMQNSVTWYFQEVDRQTGFPAIREYIGEIEYGNKTTGSDLSAYWADSSLKISPIEQVEMLKKFYDNEFGFSPDNIDAVKKSIRLSSTDYGTLYGKTGTGKANGKNTLGWFIGYLEKEEHTYFFAANILNTDHATGPAAAELTFSVLSDLKLWN